MRRLFTLFALAALCIGLTFTPATAQTQRDFDVVRGWYAQFLGREPDQAGWANWAQQVALRQQADVLADFLGSDEYMQRHGNTAEGFVNGLYSEVLGRQPVFAEINQWVGQFWRNSGNRTLTAREFLVAAETELANRPVNLTVPQFRQPPPLPTLPEPIPVLPK